MLGSLGRNGALVNADFRSFVNLRQDTHIVNLHDLAIQTADGDDVISLFQFLDHGLPIFFLLLLRSDEQEIEYGEDGRHEDERRDWISI